MQRVILYFIVILIFFSSGIILADDNNEADRIIGKWVPEEKGAVFEFFKKDNEYWAKFYWIEDKDRKDYNNPNEEKRDLPLLGMTNLMNLKYNPKKEKWEDGKIYNPRNGKMYSCQCRVSEDNKLMYFRGFLGIRLLGQSQVWTAFDEKDKFPVKDKEKN